MKKKIIAVFLLLLIIGVSAFFLTRKKENPNELTLYGNIEIRQVDLSFQVGGQIAKMLKEEGDSVKKGELVATLDNRDYKSNLEKADADVAKTLALKNDAEDKFNRNAPLVSDETISKQDYETLLNTKNKSAADYKGAIAQKNFAKWPILTKVFI